jgi:LacI family transcriptional regulator
MSEVKRVGVMMDLDKPHRRHVGMFAGIHEYAREQSDWRLIVDDWADHTLGGSRAEAPRYDGIIGRITALGAKQARRLSVPAVNVWKSSPAKDVPAVFSDFPVSGRLVAEHLLSRGFLNMAAFIRFDDQAAVSQLAAMKEAAEAAGLARWCGTLGIPWASTHREWEQTVQAVLRWMDGFTLPVGLLVLEPGHARLIVELAHERGWHIPHDVAIVCTMNDDALCEHPEPGLTCVEIPHELCGYEAAKMLDDLIDARRLGGDPFANPQTLIVPNVGIVSRFSTDFFAVADPLVQTALRYIAAHLSQPLSVEAVVNHMMVSRRTLDAKFHEAVGSTVAAEINRLRMERVKRELARGDDSIAAIARRTGFASVRTFNQRFQKTVGMSPRAFRQKRTSRPDVEEVKTVPGEG